jgi:hypothetical protein
MAADDRMILLERRRSGSVPAVKCRPSVLNRKSAIFDGASEAKLIALACSQPPEGYARWTLQMLEGKVVELNIVARASDNTIGRTLKKHS